MIVRSTDAAPASRTSNDWVYFFGLGAPALLIIFASAQAWVEPKVLFNDALSTLDAHPLTGAVSSFADLVWFAAGCVCLFAAALVGPGQRRAFLACAGTLTVMLALDDLFMVHDHVFPKILGVRERYPKAVYAITTMAYVAGFFAVIRRAKWPALLLAGGCFTASLAIDSPLAAPFLAFLPPDFIFYVVEDGLKIAGIFLWSGFHLHAAFALLSPVPRGDAEQSRSPKWLDGASLALPPRQR